MFGVFVSLTGAATPAVAEESAPAMRTVSATAEQIGQGKAMFAICSACHGMEAEGRVGMGPRLNSTSFLAAASDSFLLRTIKEGRAGTTMIAWKDTLNEDQIVGIVGYLRGMNPVGPVALDESPSKGVAEPGGELFQAICAACHGRQGGGYMETANGTGIGRSGFLDNASNGYLRYMIKHGKDQTAMRPFAIGAKTAVANLTDAEIENVIAYLRANAW